jgi:hypothetical protein
MENSIDQSVTTGPTVINEEIKSYLLETAKWGKFMAIVGYVGMGLMVLLAIVTMVGLSSISSIAGTGFPLGMMGFVYIVFAVLYYFPVTFLYRFSVQMKEGINSGEESSVISGFQNLKSLFKFMGIMLIVILSIYALVLLISIPTALIMKGSF